MGAKGGGGGNGGRSNGGGGAMNSPTMQNDLAAGLLKGVIPGSKNETRIKEMAAQGIISQNRETGTWRAGPYEGKTAKSVASQVQYRTVGERLAEKESALLNMKTKFPGHDFSKTESGVNALKAERKRLYG